MFLKAKNGLDPQLCYEDITVYDYVIVTDSSQSLSPFVDNLGWETLV